MATAAKKVVETTAVIMKLSPADIRVPKRLGALHPDKGAAIGKLMLRDGQREPIKVKRNGPRAEQPWDLVVGEHRHYGATLEGLLLDALEVEGDEVTLRQIEASENIERGSRSPIERACFVRAIADAAEARLKDRHGDLSPQQIGIRKRWDAMKTKAPGVERDEDLADAEADYSAANFAAVYGWQDATAEALGLSKRTIQADLALYRALVAPFPNLYRDLATHPLIGENASALREIASIVDVEMREALIESLIAAPDMSLADAMDGLGLSKPSASSATGATKFMNNSIKNLGRLSAGDQQQIIPQLVKTMKPSARLALHFALKEWFKQEGGEPAAASPAPVEEKPTPAVPIRQSVKPDYIACLECGAHEKQLKRHLRSEHGLQPGQYIAKWQLPRDYPLVAPNFAEERRNLAMKLGLKGGEA